MASATGVGAHDFRPLLEVGLGVSTRSRFGPDGSAVGVQGVLGIFGFCQLKVEGVQHVLIRQFHHYDQYADSFSWNKLYFMYSLACVLVFAFVDLFFIYQLWLTIPAFNFIFTSTVSTLLHVTSAVKAALNVSIPFVKSRSLQRFFNESSEYEQRVHFVGPPNHRKRTLTSYLIRPLLLAVLAVNVCICSYLSITQIDHFGYSSALSVTLKITVVTGHVLFYVYDTTCFLVLRPCCEVIRSYIEHQHMALQSIIRRGGSHDVGADKRARLVEMVRSNLCAIFYLKRSLNSIWGHAVAVSGGIVLSTSCISFYLSYVEGFRTLENLMTVLYAVLTSLDFLDITILSGSMVSEVSNELLFRTHTRL
ncbi:hypothetical protein HPB51_020003 [Rhipicephalus microplus]|uniref:Uncharacterized protein n=1 Tax=Rhipicephalus microplus TaxID=6941 RepID=A0A9J6E496_RHIMP|nr:hypothetical protein HPB51_020003 [Rhipicephalus microplus]